MALKDVKSRIATVLQGVGGIGAVFSRMRPVNMESMEQSQFVVNGVLNCCFVQRAAAELEQKGDMHQLALQWDTISVHAYYALNDENASEDAFDALLDAMLWAIFLDGSFPSLFAGTVLRTGVPRIKTVDFRHFGVRQALCHHAEITIQVMTRCTN